VMQRRAQQAKLPPPPELLGQEGEMDPEGGEPPG
jgi:hypothetical protein